MRSNLSYCLTQSAQHTIYNTLQLLGRYRLQTKAHVHSDCLFDYFLIIFEPRQTRLSFFFFNDTATPEIYTLPLHDPLPISCTDTKEAVVIDAGDDAPKILSQLDGLSVKWIVFTHAHPGHTAAKDEVKSATQAPTAMHLADATAYLKSADRYLLATDVLPFGHFALEVLITPGHTPGGLSFRVGNHVFTGDTLLAGKIGRVDLPGSSPQQMLLSLHGQLLTLADNTVVYPGHGPNSTIGAERLGNPYLRIR